MTNNAMSLRKATRTRLEKTAGMVMYEDLRAHVQGRAVFVVSPSLSLIDCGVAVAMDDVEVVQAWIDEGLLRRPSRAEMAAWAEEQHRRWRAVVVQPFTLVQET
ncbi:MAG: DUF2288 family protein [Polyangiaceae bacterium]|nr:DUF2288 family protein [Polyangiaceae bacterium]